MTTAQHRPLHGVVLLNKPPQLTSNQAMLRVRALLSQLGFPRKTGYLGTLDPLASGVLPIFVGKATRLIPEFEKLYKTYLVTCRLGAETDTMDADGQIIARHRWQHLNPNDVIAALKQFEGSYLQRVPHFSAVKHQGVPNYVLARKGLVPPSQFRSVTCKNLMIHDIRLPELCFQITGSAGTYMRALVHDLGQTLGCGAHVTALLRIACGEQFLLKDCKALSVIERHAQKQHALKACEWVKDVGPFLIKHIPVRVCEREQRALAQGQIINCEPHWFEDKPDSATHSQTEQGFQARAISKAGALLAVGTLFERNQKWCFAAQRVLIDAG